MSIWTHVVGAISVDCMGPLFSDKEDPCALLKRLTGSWQDPWYKWDKDEEDRYWPMAMTANESYAAVSEINMPCGSEGPLFYVVQNLGSRSSTNNGIVTFAGNLRDYGVEDVNKELIPYFQNLLERYTQNHVSVRCMAISIHTSGCSWFLTEDDGMLTVKES